MRPRNEHRECRGEDAWDGGRITPAALGMPAAPSHLSVVAGTDELVLWLGHRTVFVGVAALRSKWKRRVTTARKKGRAAVPLGDRFVEARFGGLVHDEVRGEEFVEQVLEATELNGSVGRGLVACFEDGVITRLWPDDLGAEQDTPGLRTVGPLPGR
jgi:hypothetical protein